MSNKEYGNQEVQILDFEELLRFIENKLAAAGKKVGRDEIMLILQAQDDFLMEKGVLEEIDEM
ncbi:hypothetical protein ACTID9_16235 [Brevibacillus fluminis]|uniref:hypothetical protein n=1 Tax=Brevibacillus fluminis TaxID=511487 RepID=UPI003F89131A